MSNILYVIGNGFDLHHGIRSKYSDFRDYVKDKNGELFDLLETYFNNEDLWWDFEATLEHFDIDTVIDDASNYLVSYGADDWSDAYHHDYQYEINRVVNSVTSELQKHFVDWVLQLDISHSIDTPRLFLHKDSRFLTFNYTNTLEKLYGIPVGNIFHIHNKAIDSDSVLILGHGRDPNTIPSLNKEYHEDAEIDDVRIIEGNEILDDYFKATYKNTQEIINENETFFTALNDVTEIVVLGHSLSEVDLGYFRRIASAIDLKNVMWKVSCFSPDNLNHHREGLVNLGIDENLITLDRMEIVAGDVNQIRLF